MVMVAITSSILAAIGWVAAPYLLTLLGVAPDVFAGALGFMRVSFVGIIFVFIYAMFQALMRGIGETKLPLLIVLGTVILNFALDPLFIFGWGAIPGEGVVGAAFATLITQALAAVIGMVIFLRGQHGIALSWRGLRPDLSYIKRAFLLGLPGSVELSTRELRDADDCGLRCWIDNPASGHDPGHGAVDGDVDAGRPEHRRRQYRARIAHRPPRHDGRLRRPYGCGPDRLRDSARAGGFLRTK
jgi:hypothetical protein